MTYEQFILASQAKQREYIVSEQERMAKADVLHSAYEREMRRLGLHPLSQGEIVDRTRELLIMAGRVEETHGDSPAMRAAWEARQLAQQQTQED